MAKSTTFEALWRQHFEPKARSHGVVDGDMDRLRAEVKNTLVTAGWASPTGAVSFVSAADVGGCLSAAARVIDRLAPGLTTARQVSRSQVLRASALSPAPRPPQALTEAVSASLEPVATSPQFTPVMAAPGARCPRCSASMMPVMLANDKAAVYCKHDRVVLPVEA